MKELNLWKLWSVCNLLSEKQSELAEDNIFVNLLGIHSNYGETDFENFLEYYSFKIEKDEIIVFNNDFVPYEDYTNSNFSYIPICLLSFSDERLHSWIKTEIDLQLEIQKREKETEKEYIKQKIEQLQKQLNNL